MKEHLDKIRQRLEAATQGNQWYQELFVPDGSNDPLPIIWSKDKIICRTEYNPKVPEQNILQATFIAHAPTDIAKLLRVVECLSEGLDAIVDPDMPDWTLEHERIGNRAARAQALATAEQILGEEPK